MPRVPIALLRQVCYARGHRLPKLNRELYPARMGEPKVVHTTAIIPFHSSGGLSHPDFGCLPNHLYQFFHSKRNCHSEMATCRYCGITMFGLLGIKEHGTISPQCKPQLLEIYRSMREIGDCVVCDMATHRQTWGIPLCGIKCDNEFRFSNPNSVKFEVKIKQVAGDAL